MDMGLGSAVVDSLHYYRLVSALWFRLAQSATFRYTIFRFDAILLHADLDDSVIIVMGTLLTVGYLLRIYVSRLALAYFGLSILVGLILIRMAARWNLQARYRAGSVRRSEEHTSELQSRRDL